MVEPNHASTNILPPTTDPSAPSSPVDWKDSLYCLLCQHHFSLCSCSGMRYGESMVYVRRPLPESTTVTQRIQRWADMVAAHPGMGDHFDSHLYVADLLGARVHRHQQQGQQHDNDDDDPHAPPQAQEGIVRVLEDTQVRSIVQDFMNGFKDSGALKELVEAMNALKDSDELRDLQQQGVVAAPIQALVPEFSIQQLVKDCDFALDNFFQGNWSYISVMEYTLLENCFHASAQPQDFEQALRDKLQALFKVIQVIPTVYKMSSNALNYRLEEASDLVHVK